MTRKFFLSLSVAASACLHVSHAEENDGWPTKERLRELFRKNSEFFRNYDPEKFKNLPLEIKDESWIDDRMEADEVGQPYLWITSPAEKGEVFGIIQVGRDGSVIAAGAEIRRTTPKKNKQIPKWDMTEAVKRASEGLQRFGWDIPSDLQLAQVQYTLDGTWYIIWHPTYGGVPEVKNDVALDQIGVVLDDDGDGVRFTRFRRGPAPAHTVPKLSRTEGIVLATKAVPKIMATGIYRSWMPKDLSPIELKQFDLCVTVPNWILDPGGYKLSTNQVITERRLCWRAAFLLLRQDVVGEKDGKRFYRDTQGLVYVLVDAVTGEIVGGNMEPIANDAVSQKYGN